jgi:F-type H+-transporting ATPase subunit epsilon
MSELEIKFKIVTPEKTVFEEAVSQATLPTTDGEITILPNHRSYIASLCPGELMVKPVNSADGKNGEEILISISGGFIEFHGNELVVLADTAERAEEIDLARAEEGRKKAEELKNQRVSMDENEYARVAAAIQKESARIRVARKHRTRSGMTMDN